MNDVILIDARNCVFRHGFTRGQLSTAEGKPTGAIFGVLSCLLRLQKFHPNAKFVFCWDGKETRKSWRHILCATYKANRHSTTGGEPPIEVKRILSQIPAIKEIIDVLGFPQYEVDHLEADDLIGVIATYLSKQKDVNKVLLYSMDKDLYQLIGPKIVVVRDLDKSLNCEAFDKKALIKKFNVAPTDWVKYRSLIGDPSDGIKAPIKKVGKIRALKLLAAGLDPSNVQPKHRIEKQYRDEWNAVHMNYRISKIVTDHKDKVLLQSNRLRLKHIVNLFKKNKGFMRKVAITPVLKKQFIAFCSKYELDYILENRHRFYSLGR